MRSSFSLVGFLNKTLPIAIGGFLFYRTVINPRMPSHALIVWAITFCIFGAALIVRASLRNHSHPHYGFERVLKRSYDLSLSIMASFIVLFTLSALEAAPLAPQTLNDRPDMLIPILLLHAVFSAFLLSEFYQGQDPLKLGVALTLACLFLIYGGANFVGYGSLLMVMLMVMWYQRYRIGQADFVPSPFDLPIFVFILICALSTAFGVCPFRSSFSLLSIATAFCGALLIGMTTNSRRELLRLIFLAAGAGIYLVALGCTKLVMLTSNFGAGFTLNNRLWLPLVNPNGVAAHITLTFPLMIALALSRRKRLLSIVFFVLSALAVVCVVLSYSKGGLIGFVAAVACFVGLRKRTDSKAARRRQRTATIAVVVVGALFATLILLGEVGQRLIERVTDRISLESRGFFWGLGQHIIARNPVLGVGMNNSYVHTEIAHLLETVLEVSARESVLSHSHSTYLFIGEGTGVTGLCAFVFLLITFITRGMILLRRMKPGTLRLITRGILASIVGFSVHGLFDLEFAASEFDYALLGYIGLLAAVEQVWRRETGQMQRFSRTAYFWAKANFAACLVILILSLAVTQISMKSGGLLPGFAAQGLCLDPDYFETLAKEKVEANEFEAAAELYGKAIARQRNYPSYHEKLGWLCWLRKDVKSAASHFDQAVKKDPPGAIGGEHYTALALFLFTHKKYNLARTAMVNAIQTEPEVLNRDIWQYVPCEFKSQTDWIVRKEFLTYDVRDEHSWEDLRERIIAHLKGEVGPAAKMLGPGMADVLRELDDAGFVPQWSVEVMLHYLYGRYIETLATQPIEAKKILLNAGRAYSYAGWDARAESIYKEGLKFFKGDPNFRTALAELFRKNGEYEKAAEMFAQVGDHFSQGMVWITAGQYDQAIAAFSCLLAGHMEHQRPLERAKALTIIGMVYERRGDIESLNLAKEFYEKALFTSETAANYRRLSDLLYRMGLDERAKTLYRKALEIHQTGQPLTDDSLENLIED